MLRASLLTRPAACKGREMKTSTGRRMCGIAGILALGRSYHPVLPTALERLNNLQALRGPDGQGIWIDAAERIGLAHRRLAIIDVTAGGAQPMASRDGRLHISFNGEIYNHRALRAALMAQGVVFQSASDTEVLLHLYDRFGPAMVERLEGMFAFALWDSDRQGLLLARDAFGIKPLYLQEDAGQLRFASQVRTLADGMDLGVDPAGLIGFLLLGYVPEPHTIARGVRALPAGSYLWADADGVRPPVRYFTVRDTLLAAAGQPPATLAEAVGDSVTRHMEADVPVGLFLSAGIDSTSILGLLPAAERARVRTLTMGFAEYQGRPDDEAPLAARVAALYGAPHQTRYVDRAAFLSIAGRFLSDMDQPSTDGLNSWLVSWVAATAGLKVALSGVGGDELLGGYPGFRQIPRLVGACAPFADFPLPGHLLRQALAPLIGHVASPKYAGLLEYGTTVADAWFLRRALFMPWELPRILDPDMVRDGLADLDLRDRLHHTVSDIPSPHQQVMVLEIEWYMRNQLLRDADWAGMAHGVEIRTPLVDRTLFMALAGNLASSTPPGKQDLLTAAGPDLAALLAGRPKTGFTVPLRAWMSGQDGTVKHGGRSWALRLLRNRPDHADWLQAA